MCDLHLAAVIYILQVVRVNAVVELNLGRYLKGKSSDIYQHVTNP